MKINFPPLEKTFPSLSPPHRRSLAGSVYVLLAFAVIVTASSFNSFVHKSVPDANPHRIAPPEWVLFKTVNNVDFYYQFNDCSGKKVVFLKLNNRNKQAVKVSWKEVFTTQFEKDKTGMAGTKHLLIGTGEISAADCSNIKIKELVVLPSHVNPTYNADIQKFSITDLMVTNQ